VTSAGSVARHALICGFGSIGRRHLRHLRALGVQRIDAYRTGHATMPADDTTRPDREFHSLDAALAERPQVVVVANPTSLHVATARAAVAAGCHVLVEKPLSDAVEGCEELALEAEAAGAVVSVACNLRFHPSVLALREWISSGEPLGRALTARAHFGTYLPDWHPWEDYRTSYAARAELGGGAALTHVHEIDLIGWLFGPAERIAALPLAQRPLGTDVDEACAVLVGHAGGVLSSLTLSFVEKPASRTLDVTFSGGTANVDLLSGRWSMRGADGGYREGGVDADFDFDETYRRQAEAFLQAARTGGAPTVGVREGLAAVRTALAVRA